jgi:hypothetical protein
MELFPMKLRIHRVFTNTLDPQDPERLVTTDQSRYAQHWWTIKVRAESSTAAWGFAKRVQWAPDIHRPGMVEAWSIGLDQKLTKLRRIDGRVVNIAKEASDASRK